MRFMRFTTLALTVVAFLAYVVVFGRLGGVEGLFFVLPFTMIPFVVTAYFATIWRAAWSQVVLLATTIAYAAWFIYIYVAATSPFVFLYVSIYALPVLFLLWILAWAIDWEREDRWTE